MRKPQIKFITGLAVALTVLFFLISGPPPLEPSAVKSTEKAESGADPEAGAQPVPEEHGEPELATRPPRVGDVPRRMV